ncbi:pitrilysin family protein [Neisseria leonii]|uniref:M16 family metallopeptidase n=1 Tax=Neisseria leonii TaxID=2995413 RepID=UPI00237C45F2|nr:pitrilysin family protein [Neisseria sp. 3986]MDD9325966.1 insulinase family protein [Neisseria sp. 3986]
MRRNKPFLHSAARILLTAVLIWGFQTASALDIQRWQTPEDNTLTLSERHELPTVHLRVVFKGAGTAAGAQPDLGGAVAAMLVYGTQKYSEDALRDESNRLGISIDASAGTENSAVTLVSLSRPDTLNAAADLLNEVLVRPVFDAAVWAREQRQAVTALKQSEQSPSFLADRAATLLNYGSHPYANGARSSEAGILGLSRDDLAAFHRRFYRRDNAYVSVVGDVTREQAEALAGRILRGLPRQSDGVRQAVPEVVRQAGREQRIPFADKEQATVVMSMPLLGIDDPDRIALTVGNYILGGGGFDSRLMKILRDQEGLVYGVSSSMSPLAEKGPFTVSFTTQKGGADRALAVARRVLADFAAQGPTEAELQQAKNYLIGSHPLRFDTNAKVLPHTSSVGVYQLPTDRFDRYPQEVADLTADEIRRVWQRRVDPSRMNAVLVGAQ